VLFIYIYLAGSQAVHNRVDNLEERLENYEQRVERIDQRWEYQNAFNRAVNDSLKIIPARR